jgi:hypothetical protein
MNDTVVLVTRDGMGDAEPALQHKLITTYLRVLLEDGALPGAVCFYADGVKLVVDGSPALPALRELEDRGVRLILCRTCLEYYGLADRVRVGIVGGMGDIVAAQVAAGKVISV